MRTRSLILILCSLLILLGGIKYSTKSPSNHANDGEFGYIPKASTVRFLSMGQEEALASLMWVRTLIYYGDHLLKGKKASWVLHMSNLITELNPKWKPAYRFVGNVFKSGKKDSTDLVILKRGAETFPNDWRLSFYYAQRVIDKDSNWMYASNIMKPFENKPNVPKYIQGLSKSYKIFSYPIEQAIIFLLEDYLNPALKTYQKGAAIKIQQLVLNTGKLDGTAKTDLLLKKLSQGILSKHQVFISLIHLYQNHLSEKQSNS